MLQASLIPFLEALTNFYQGSKDCNRTTIRIMVEALQKSINLWKVTLITNGKYSVEQDISSCFCLVNMTKLKLFKSAVKKEKKLCVTIKLSGFSFFIKAGDLLVIFLSRKFPFKMLH